MTAVYIYIIYTFSQSVDMYVLRDIYYYYRLLYHFDNGNIINKSEKIPKKKKTLAYINNNIHYIYRYSNDTNGRVSFKCK